jgi:pilus assembly protein CpaF
MTIPTHETYGTREYRRPAGHAVPDSPLLEIEQAVQERAKQLDLRLSASGGQATLRQLIELEVAEWNDEYRRGRRDVELTDPEGVIERAYRNLARYGPLTPLLDDDDVWEIMVNAPDDAFRVSHYGL